MVGRDLDTFYPKADVAPGDVRLSVRNLTREGVFKNVSFDVRAGEIVALAGLVGAGRSEVARAIFGIDPVDGGEVKIAGKKLALGHPATAVRAGLALVPEDRRAQGLALELSIARNASLTVLGRLMRHGLITAKSESTLAADWGKRLRLKASDLEAPVGTLSGGNQQKVGLAKWLTYLPKVLVLSEPTRGMDVGAKEDVVKIVRTLRDQGMAVVVVSTEPEAILSLADRILVMKKGEIVREFADEMVSKDRLLEVA
jgi:rhamnose transport system ATP-binding protein